MYAIYSLCEAPALFTVCQTEAATLLFGSEGLQHADQLANLRCHRVIRLRTVCSAGGIVIMKATDRRARTFRVGYSVCLACRSTTWQNSNSDRSRVGQDRQRARRYPCIAAQCHKMRHGIGKNHHPVIRTPLCGSRSRWRQRTACHCGHPRRNSRSRQSPPGTTHRIDTPQERSSMGISGFSGAAPNIRASSP